MTTQPSISGYNYETWKHNCSHSYLLPQLKRELLKAAAAAGEPKRAFDLGCGNGSIAAAIAAEGWEVTGVDPSDHGIEQGCRAYPHLRLAKGSAYDDLVSVYGRFPVVTSLEVVEHCYAPRDYARTLYDLVEPGGTAIISTPYHGYVKNLALAITGKMDAHFTALWDNGHIKFWSIDTLGALLEEAGFKEVRFKLVGRFGPLAKSMFAIARKPSH